MELTRLIDPLLEEVHMSEKKRISPQANAVIPAGVVGIFGLASAAMGQTYIGATASNGWNASSNILVNQSENHNAIRVASNLVSGINLDPTGQYSDSFYHQNGSQNTDWLSDGGGAGAADPTGLPFSAWVEFTFDQSYNLGAIDIWQDNQQPQPYSYQGMQDCTIQVSNDGSHWTTVYTGAIPKESDLGAPNYNEPLSLQVNANEMAAQYVVITAATTNWNYATNGDTAVALDAVEFQTSPYVPPPPPPPPAWANNVSGDWNNAGNWTSATAPNGVGAEADFLGAVTSNQTVYTNSAVTVGTLIMTNANTYVISGTGSLTLQATAGNNAQITVGNGTQELDLPVSIASNTTLNIASGSTLLVANPITVDSGSTLTQTGTGTVNYQSHVNVQSTGAITFGNSTHANTLNISNGGTATISGNGNVVQVDNLADGGTLDVGKNELLINYGNTFTTSGSDPVSSIRSLLASGYNGGQWNGPGIISTGARTLTNGLKYGIGWADGADQVVTGLSSGVIELKYTLLGDANLDGTVNGSDFSILAANFGLGVTNWDQGDFLYGSSVNGADFSALAANFGQGDSYGSSVTETDWNALEAFASANGLTIPASVPEPATLGLLAIGSAATLVRRRRR
jgi:hypothetical protein